MSGVPSTFSVGATQLSVKIPVTLTVIMVTALPSAPEQVSVNDVFATNGPTVSLPLVVLLPVQPPLAVQLFTLAELQVSVVGLPLSISGSAALSETVGEGASGSVSPGSEGGFTGSVSAGVGFFVIVASTVTVTEAVSLPPLPEQINVKVRELNNEPVD